MDVTKKILVLLFVQQMIKAELIGYWPLDCDFDARDASGAPQLSMRYNRASPTAPQFLCSAPHGLKGSASFAVSGDLISFKYLQADNPGSEVLGLSNEVTWIGYMMLPQDEFMDTDAPIFSLEKSQDQTSADAGLGILWWNSALVLVMSGNAGQRTLRMSIGTGMTRDTWYRVALSVSTVTGVLVYKVTRLSDYLVTSQSTVTVQNPGNLEGMVPYTSGNIRFGAYSEDNNNNNFNFFRGQLSCVQLYNHALNMDDLDSMWQSIPPECRDEIFPFSAAPLYGPEAGGTFIVMRYDFLVNTGGDSFPNVVVKLGGVRITPVTMINDTHITVPTPRYRDGDSLTGDVPRDLSVKVDRVEVSNAVFVYKPNPVITDVYPLETIVAGGTLLTVVGSNMDSVARPILTVTGIHRATVNVDTGATISGSTVCDVSSGETMTCSMPALQFTGQTRTRREAEADERTVAQYYIGFELDGVPTYRNLSENLPEKSRVTVFMNPEFETFDKILKYNPDKKERLNVKGNYMDTGATIGDYYLMLEETECGNVDMVSNSLSCLPPKKEPTMSRTGAFQEGKIRINVNVGNFDFYIGQMEYVQSSAIDSDLAVIIGASAGGTILVIIILITTVICCIRCRRANQKEQKHKKKAMAGTDGRHFDNTMYNSEFHSDVQGYDNAGKSNGVPRSNHKIAAVSSSKPTPEMSQFRLNQNMFIQNEKQLSSGKPAKKSSNSKDNKKRKHSEKEDQYYADVLANTDLPGLRKDKGGITKKNTYTEDPNAKRTGPPPSRGYVNRNGPSPTNGYLELLEDPPQPQQPSHVRLPYKKGQAPNMPRPPAR